MQTPVSPVLPEEDEDDAASPLLDDQPEDEVEPQPEVEEPLQPEVEEPLQPLDVVLPDVPEVPPLDDEVHPLEPPDEEDDDATGTPFVPMSPPGTRARHTRPALHLFCASHSWPSSTSPL
jgi:hypothetical protein